MFPETIKKLRSGSLELIRERFCARWPGETVIATFARHVISEQNGTFFQRSLNEDFEFGEADVLLRSGESVLETRALAERIVDAVVSGRDVTEDMDAFLDRVSSGHDFSVKAVKESVIGVLTTTNEWRSFYRRYEPRIRKILHGELGVLEDRRLKPKYRKIRLGNFNEEDKAAAIPSVRMSFGEVLARLAGIRAELAEMVIPDVSRDAIEQDLFQMRGMKRILEDELAQMSDHISGLDINVDNVSEAAATYDLVADEVGRYEVMALFLRRATNVAAAA